MKAKATFGSVALLSSAWIMPTTGVSATGRTPEQQPPIDTLETLARVQNALGGDVYVSRPCNPSGYYPIVGAGGELAVVSVTGHRIIIQCKSGTEYKLAYAELKASQIVDNGGYYGKHPCVATAQIGFCLLATGLSDKYVALKFLDDIKMLAKTRSLETAVDDLALVNPAANPSPEPGEVERRAQVRAEVLLKDGQQVAAARVYRHALQERPGWAQGYYNLALVYGTLELYPEAVFAMRRYLQLDSAAPDARAAQDQIYAWEALIPEAPPPAVIQK